MHVIYCRTPENHDNDDDVTDINAKENLQIRKLST